MTNRNKIELKREILLTRTVNFDMIMQSDNKIAALLPGTYKFLSGNSLTKLKIKLN